MKYIIGLVALVIGVLVLYSAIGSTDTSSTTAETPVLKITEVQTEATGAQVDLVEVINKEDKQEIMQEQNKAITMATFKTNQGDIKVELYTEDAPNTVANFVKLASEGFYDGIKFHRVIKGFMIQGGDPLSKEEGAAWGTGGPGYAFADEIHANNKNDKYTLAMANSGPNTNGSQFFINTNDNNFLDPKHTVFGKVISGMDTVDTIENTATGQADRPVEAQVIESIVLE